MNFGYQKNKNNNKNRQIYQERVVNPNGLEF